MNHEGYRDPTADIAVKKADRMPESIWQILSSIRTLLHPLGLSIESITFYDRASGRHYHWQKPKR